MNLIFFYVNIKLNYLLQFMNEDEIDVIKRDEWIAFCSFHLGDYQRALKEFQGIKSKMPMLTNISLNIAVCMFYLGKCVFSNIISNFKLLNPFYKHIFIKGMYEEAQESIEDIPNTSLKIRLLFHLAHKFNNDDQLMELHESLRDVVEDQLTLACLHYLRAHYQEAIDIYKRLLLDNK